MTSVSYRGLYVEGTVTHDRGTYDDPPWTEVEIESVDIDDWDEFSSHEFFSKVGISEGTARMLEAYHRTTGRTLPRLEALILSRWEDGISEALQEAYDNW